MTKRTGLHSKVNQQDIPLARFSKAANLAVKRILAAHGTPVTREQEAILCQLCHMDGMNQVELANKVGQERNNLSRTLTILEDKGCITREACRHDKRNSLVFVTDIGRKVHETTSKAMKQYKALLLGEISAEEMESFIVTMNAMIDNLEHFNTENAKNF